MLSHFIVIASSPDIYMGNKGFPLGQITGELRKEIIQRPKQYKTIGIWSFARLK